MVVHTVGPSYVTAMYFEPIYKDGVNINPDRNISTTEVTCHCPDLTATEPSTTTVYINQNRNIEIETKGIWEDISSD